MSTTPTIPSTQKASSGIYFTSENFLVRPSWILEQHQNDSYQKGLEDGRKNMEIELTKMGKALYDLAYRKVRMVCDGLIKVAEENEILINEIHLKLTNWDCATALIIVKLEDFLAEKIDLVYAEACKLTDQVNDDNFHWDYSITYHSDSINKEKLVSDGFQYTYEHSPRSRQTQ